jgi:hypothetical protein
MCSRYDKIQHTEFFSLYGIFVDVEWEIEVMESEMKNIHVACSQLFGEWERENVRPNNSIQLHAPLYTHTHTVLDHLRKTTKKPIVERGEKLEWMQKINNIEPRRMKILNKIQSTVILSVA